MQSLKENDRLTGDKNQSKFIENLLNSPLVFDYANLYYHNNSLESFDDFKLSNNDFELFKKMSVDEKYNKNDKSQEGINNMKMILKKEGIRDMNPSFEVLNTTLRESKLKLIDLNKLDILSNLEGEIIKRYFYREGMYAYFISTDAEIFKAQEVVIEKAIYQNILK